MTISYFDQERPEKKSCFILHVHIKDVCNTFSYHKWMLISLKECVLLNIQLKLVHTYSVMKYTYRRKVQRRYMTQLFARRTRNILVTKRNFYLHVYRIHVTIVKLSVILICILSNIYTLKSSITYSWMKLGHLSLFLPQHWANLYGSFGKGSAFMLCTCITQFFKQ